jgi:hypothetical protein
VNSANTIDRDRLSLIVEKLIRDSRRPLAHAQETISAQLSSLDAVRLHYQTSTPVTRSYISSIVVSLGRNISAEDQNRRLLAQLNEAHSGDMEPEERRFLEHSLEYYRRRLLEGK